MKIESLKRAISIVSDGRNIRGWVVRVINFESIAPHPCMFKFNHDWTMVFGFFHVKKLSN